MIKGSQQYLMQYVEPLGFYLVPQYDEDGDYCGSMHLNNFIVGYQNIKTSLSYEKFLKQTDIINTLNAYNLEIEPFWYAVVFAYKITEVKCVGVHLLSDTAKNQLQQIVDYHKHCNDVEMRFSTKGKPKIMIYDKKIVELVVKTIERYLQTTDDCLDWKRIDVRAAKQSYPVSIQMWYFANAFIQLFDHLKLPNKRGRESIVSYNKLLLISRIIYYVGFTRNDSFLHSENSLKGILRKYADFELNSFA